MVEYVAGVDGGGTKTSIEIRSLNGQASQRKVISALNINGQSPQSAQQALDELLDCLHSMPGGLQGCAALCIGAAGLSNPQTAEAIRAALQQAGFNAPLLLAGDHQVALHGALDQAEGIILIAGTGSICYGLNSLGHSARSGGWGHLIDDEGSGYAIGRDILSVVVRAEDGRGPQTCLTHLVFDTLKISSMPELIYFVYSRETTKRQIAALAPLLSLGLEQNDEPCLYIVEKASRELAQLVVPVAQRLGLERGQIAFLGSVLTKNTTIAQELTHRLLQTLPSLHVVTPKEDAACGAARMALEYIHKKEG